MVKSRHQLVFPSTGDGHEADAEDGVENPGPGRWRFARRQRKSTAPASTEIVSSATTDAASVPANQRSDTKPESSRKSSVLAVFAVLQPSCGSPRPGTTSGATSLTRESSWWRCRCQGFASTAPSAIYIASCLIGGCPAWQSRLWTSQDGQQRPAQRLQLRRHQLRRDSAYNILF